jgi:hypothetical protein
MAPVKEIEASFRNKVVTGLPGVTPALLRAEWSANAAEEVCDSPTECGRAEHADCGCGGLLSGAIVGTIGKTTPNRRSDIATARPRETAPRATEVPRSLGVREQRRAVKKPAIPATGER